MSAAFVHLHVHSEYSLADGVVRLEPLAASAAQHRHPAVALTDLCNLHGAIKFHRACLAHGVKPLLGCDIWVENPLDSSQSDRVIVLCRDHLGYRNLSQFLTEARLRDPHADKPVVAWQSLARLRDGLLVLFDDHHGPLANLQGQAVRRLEQKLLGEYQRLFADRLYFQVSRIGHAGEQGYIRRAARLAAACGVGLVATNRVEFLKAEEFDAHEIRVCINDRRTLADARRPRCFTPQQYLRHADEMAGLFADLPEAIDNSVEIARRCNVFIEFDRHFMPAYPGAGAESVETILRRQAETGLAERLAATGKSDGLSEVDYADRLDMELEVVTQMGYPGYFLIVADFIHWARANDIPVGPGRGSGAGSLVAWACGITEIDPLRYGLLFERFLNPERVSLPDFDIDFCVEGRDRVIDYVVARYGRDQVAQITTFGTMAAKAVIRDVGRAMALPFGLVDQIAKAIPFRLKMTLKIALKEEEALRKRYQEEADVQELIDNAMRLEGIARNVGTHAAGVVIAPQALTQYTPLYASAHGQTITQLDQGDLEAIGLVKFDILGLRNLTIIDLATKMINQRKLTVNEPPLRMQTLPLDDAPTFALIQRGCTTAIFQLESSGMKQLIVRLRPDKFDDLVALVALYRPGPLESGMVDDFINRKHGRASIAYPHPDLASILEPTYGVIVYQEQVMQIAQTLAGYSLGEADLLRRAMGKKKAEEMAQQRAVFKAGAVTRGVRPRLAESIFDLMEKFAGYGFNKSHSVAYALVAYHTAWLKTHHPAAYMAATLSAELGDTDTVMSLLYDCAQLGLKVLPPDVNACSHRFRPVDDDTILYGVGAVKGIGKNVSDCLEAERERNGRFEDLFDLCRRLDPRVVSKRALEALVKCGAMDSLGAHRAALLADIGNATQAAEQAQQCQRSGQSDMFGEVGTPPERPRRQPLERWSEQQRLAAEKEALGLYLTGHPYDRYRAELAGVTQANPSEMDVSAAISGMFAGLIIGAREIKTRRGRMMVVVLDNAIERLEVSLYAEKYQDCRAALQKGKVLIVHGEFSADDFTGGVKMTAESVADINAFRSQCLRRIRINLFEERLNGDFLANIRQILSAHRGGGVEIAIHYHRVHGETGILKLGAGWKIHPAEQLIDTLTRLIGADNMTFTFEAAPLRNTKPTHPYAGPKLAATG